MGCGHVAKKRRTGDLIREYKTVHEENSLSSWLRDDTEGTAEEVKERDRKEKEAKSG